MKIEAASGPLIGATSVPGDKSISHRAVILAALADGTATLRGLGGGADNQSTVRAMRALGVPIEQLGPGTLSVRGVGLEGLGAPSRPVDCGNSGTTVRLLAGVVAGRGFSVTFEGDASLSRRPMARIADPLRKMGATVEGAQTGEVLHLPLTVGGDGLSGITWESPVASAQVKSAILLAGLRAEGETRVIEPAPSRDHTERMLAAMGAPLERLADGARVMGPVDGLVPVDFVVPGDPSSAAFLAAAAVLVPGSAIRIRGVCVNPTRAAWVDVLKRFGADVVVEDAHDVGGEPVGTLVVHHGGTLSGTTVPSSEVPSLIDEVPILAAVAAAATGETRFEGVGDLRAKESDRLATTVSLLAAFGVTAHTDADTLVVEGQGAVPTASATIDAAHDHRVAMTAGILGLAAGGVEVTGGEVVAVSFPGFEETLGRLQR